jgi:multiphosphoryl transfer protein
MRTMRGTPASPGVAVGPAVALAASAAPAGGAIDARDADAETLRLEAALESAALELEALAERIVRDGHREEGAIFEAQASMARDPGLRAMAEQRIRASHEDAVAAVLGAADTFARQLRALENELLAARATDVIDVGERVARRLSGIPEPHHAQFDVPSIVVAADLQPSMTAALPRDRLLGIVLEAGSATAHAAILARAYGIPAAVGVGGILAAVGSAGPDGNVTLAIDGTTGEVVIDPDEPTRGRFARASEAARVAGERDLGERELPAITSDGVRVTLLANIGGPAEASRAVALGAEGVGLFRTEFLFIERPYAPSEDEQLSAYREAVAAFAPYPVTIRLLDVGGDKPIPYLPIAAEANPFLGVRALRLAPDQPDLFVAQLRAAMRAAVNGPVKVMAPMIADGTDAGTLLELADRAAAELERAGVEHGSVALGVMLEIPSAILVGRSYFGRLAFASLGTNDLLQYTLAVDRTNPALGRYQDFFHPALLRLIREAVSEAARAGIELSVCGEMAGDPGAALCLVGLGLRQLSMAAGSLPAVRRAIRGQAAERLASAARWALDASSAGEVRERFEGLATAPTLEETVRP